MLKVLSFSDFEAHAVLRCEMLRDRASQFVERLNWDLRIFENGGEIDRYDGPGTIYVVVVRDGRHAGSLRLRAPSNGTMTEHIFGALWFQAAENLRSAFEVTRFCVSPKLGPDIRTEVVAELLLGLCRYCLQNHIQFVFGIVFPSVVRVLSRAGWRGEHLASDVRATEHLILMSWEVSEYIAWEIQDRMAQILDKRWAKRTIADLEGVAA